MSSKLRKLKQQAYEAGRKRDWSGAAAAYAQILEMDKNNPSLLNEYGDVCLKAGDTAKALRQFLAAAAKYKQNGLLNNAQAVYKKVLRHDEKNLNANWFLAEIRSSQGLVADGVSHALTFLSCAEEVSGEIKEIFLKRCVELFELYPSSEQVLERVEGIFRIRDMQLEAARAGCLRAIITYRGGDEDGARASVARLREMVPELANYSEHGRWLEATGQRAPAAAPADFADVNTVNFDGGGAAAAAPDAGADATGEGSNAAEAAADDAAADGAVVDAVANEVADEVAAITAPEADVDTGAESPADAAAAFEDFLQSDGEPLEDPDGTIDVADADVDADVDDAAEPRNGPEPDELEKDDEGCISIDLDDDGGTSFDSLIEDAAAGVEAASAAAEPEEPAPAKSRGSVNLLDEILAEEGEDLLRSSETEQVSTIASEIGRNLGDDEQPDPDTQYQQGLVYLEMGLYDQAALSFKAAACDPAHALQACEMWGIALHREGRLEEALEVLLAGLGDEDGSDRGVLGLHYQAGRILEELERADEAQEHFRRVHGVDAGFADVARRLRAPVG